MPKRKNPFGEITPLQLKTHVGFEQMATQQEREQVYGEAAGAWPRPDVLLTSHTVTETIIFNPSRVSLCREN